MKKGIFAICVFLLLFTFSACTSATAQPEMQIGKAELTESEKDIADLLGADLGNTIYDFAVDDTIETVQVNIYELKDGEWDLISGGGGLAFHDARGRIALDFERLSGGIRVALQSESTCVAAEHSVPPTDETSPMSSATSYMSDNTPIAYEQEIPLVIQIYTTKDEINSYNVDYFSHPEEYQKFGYEHVYAATILFSQKTLGEMDPPLGE